MATTTGDDPNTQHAPEDGSATAPAPPRPQGNSFFTWIRGLGVLRTPGWIGGVAAGVAARLGIDPILVRGILVVVAVLGGPAVLLYALAWLFLPDENDVIHAEELGRGRFTPAIAGIGALVLLSLLPLTQGFWYAGSLYWGEPHVGASIGRVLWTAVLLTALVLFVVWIARRSSGTGTPPAPSAAGTGGTGAPAPASTDASSAPQRAESSGSHAAGSTPTAVLPPAPFAPEPPRPGTEASAEELTAWRAQQEDWKRQRAAWAAEQKRTDREIAARVAQENARRNAEAAIERARIRRLTRPRTSGAYIGIALGTAVVAGSLAALVSDTGSGGADATLGFAVALLVLGAAIVLAGAMRRRSGFLSFLGFVAMIALLISLIAPDGRRVLFPGSYGIDTTQSGSYAMPAGELILYARDDGDDTVAEVDLWQGAGAIDITVEDGQTVLVEFETDRRGDVLHLEEDGSTGELTPVETIAPSRFGNRISGEFTAGSPGAPDLIVTIWQGAGEIRVRELEVAE